MTGQRTLQIQRLRLLDVAKRCLRPAERLEPSWKLYTYCGRLSSWIVRVCTALLQEPDIADTLHVASFIIVMTLSGASAGHISGRLWLY